MTHDTDIWANARSARQWGTLAIKVLRDFSRHDMTVSASAISFLALFALFSAISAFVAFYGLFADPGQLIDALQQMQGFVPADVFVSMLGEMRSVSTHASATLVIAGSFSLVVGCGAPSRVSPPSWWHSTWPIAKR